MSNTSEANFSKSFRAFCARDARLKVYTFEGVSRQGIPDLYVVGKLIGGVWIELKAMTNINHRVPFRRGQTKWLFDHAKAGGRSLVLIKCRTSFFLIDSYAAKRYERVPLSQMPSVLEFFDEEDVIDHIINIFDPSEVPWA